MIECLLFDNDGTLVDSEYLCNLGIAELFAELGVHLDVEHLVRCYRGGKMSEILSSLARQNGVSLPEHFLSRYRQRVADLFESELKSVPGVVDALQRLTQIKAVVSNGPRSKIEHALALCHLSHFFKGNLFSAYDLQSFKPDPGIYLKAARWLNVPPDRCAVVEDSLPGAKAGSQAGMLTFFYNKYNEACDLPNVIPFQDMRALPQLIQQQG